MTPTPRAADAPLPSSAPLIVDVAKLFAVPAIYAAVLAIVSRSWTRSRSRPTWTRHRGGNGR